tara:strand:- start:22 stop:621 length:600 start_codon:yes stop_codon:yes gene_type:complete
VKKNILILDYGIGNYGSLIGSLNNLNCKAYVSNDKNLIKKSDLIILPGVGNFKAAMTNLKKNNLNNFLLDISKRGKYLFGICLGMQLLASSSNEDGFETGLNIIPGKVRPYNFNKHNIGWSKLKILKKENLLKDVENSDFYFQHKYSFDCHSRFKIANCRSNSNITSIIKNRNTFGVQFHPEKSQINGQRLMLNLINKI